MEMKQSKVLTVAQALWIICFVVGFLFLSPEDPNLVAGLPIKVNPFSIVHTLGYLAIFLANHYLVIRGQASPTELAFLSGVTFVYIFAGMFVVQDMAKFLGWMFLVVLVIGLEYHFPDWPRRVFTKRLN